MEKIDKIQQFNDTAKLVDAAKEASSNKTSLVNRLMWQAFFILRDGTVQDEEALKGLVSKEGALNRHKAAVSKARYLEKAIRQGEEVIIPATEETAEVTVNSESLKAFKFTETPPFSVATLDKILRNEVKAANEADEVNRLAEKQLIEQHGKETIAEVEQMLGSKLFNEAMDNAKADIANGIAAEKAAKAAKNHTAESVMELIASLAPTEQAKIIDYCLNLDTSSVKVA